MPTTQRHLRLNNACSGLLFDVRCALTWSTTVSARVTLTT